MKAFRILLTAIILTQLVACDTTVQTGESTRILPNITGGAGELLVVVDDYIWEGPTGETLKDVLKEEYPGLPQSEPLFYVTQVTASSFDKLFKFHRSILLVTIKESAEKATIKFRKNVWAKPQIMVQIVAPDLAELETLVKANGKRIQRFFTQYDRQRLTESYQESQDLEIQKMMATNHHIRLGIPRGYNVDVSTDDYTSVSIETPDYSQVLHVYEYPAENEKTALKTGQLLKKRNEFTRQYVKGPREGSYMTTSENYPPVIYDIHRDSMNIVEIRGLWELENGYMGGPFISHSVYDDKRNRVVTVEGYVYNPNQKKSIKMKQLEAIIYSLEIF